MAVAIRVGALGADVSVNVLVVAGEILPAVSLLATDTVPDDCGLEDVAE